MRLTDKPRTVNREKVKLPIEKINFTFQEIFKMSLYRDIFYFKQAPGIEVVTILFLKLK